MAKMADITVDIATEEEKRGLDAFVAKLFREWVDFAMGQKDIRVGGKVANRPLHPSGRYAASLSYSRRKVSTGKYKVTFSADSFSAPEAEAIEFGRKSIDLKKYMLGKDGRQMRVIPIRSTPSMLFTPPPYGPTRKRSSEAKKSLAEGAHNAPESGVYRVMTNQPGSWIMRKWPRKGDESGKMVPFQPAHLLMEKLRLKYGGSNA